jgi:hypothetical protein
MAGEGFKGHSVAGGRRLPAQVELGPPGLFRQVREVAAVAVKLTDMDTRGTDTPTATRGRRGPKSDHPWEAAGVSRRTWFRRKKKEGE